jgi:glyoxylase-like metal-dependent hydrolase (beta-lactamase superfamily II)
VGDLSLRLYHVPGLHTRTNLTIYVPELGLLFTRREFQQGSLPILEPGLDLGKLIRSLEDVLASGRPVSHIMVGHGEPVNNPDLNVPLTYLRTLAEVVRTAKREGRTIEQVKDDPRFKAIPEVVKYPKVHQANLELVWSQ